MMSEREVEECLPGCTVRPAFKRRYFILVRYDDGNYHAEEMIDRRTAEAESLALLRERLGEAVLRLRGSR